MTEILKPIYLNSAGIQARIYDGAITNIGGTSHPTFTVNGKGLLFDDGTSTNGGGSGSGGSSSTLQAVYNNSSDSHGNASITLEPGKDFVIYDDNNSAIYFKIQSTTGDITVTGNLTVLGSTTLTSTTEISDHWTLTPSHPSTISLSIEPAIGNNPLADLVNVKIAHGGSPVFRVDATGKTILKTLQVNENVTVVGLINGVDIVSLSNEVYDHITSVSFPKHTASQIQVIPVIASLPGVNNVQAALQGLATQISNISLGSSLVRGFEFIQSTALSIWHINHSQNTRKVQFTAYDQDGNWLLPNSFKIIDENSVEMKFGAPQAGSVILMMF